MLAQVERGASVVILEKGGGGGSTERPLARVRREGGNEPSVMQTSANKEGAQKKKAIREKALVE